MPESQTTTAALMGATASRARWKEPVLGLAIGIAGGVLESVALASSLSHGIATGGVFGLLFALLFARRANTAGAGLIWGLAAAFLLWLTLPAAMMARSTAATYEVPLGNSRSSEVCETNTRHRGSSSEPATRHPPPPLGTRRTE